jgi:hypothetical protein
MIKFKVAIVDRKKANVLLMNSNKLKNCMYNLGQTFLVHPNDYSDAVEILDRNMIKVKAV